MGLNTEDLMNFEARLTKKINRQLEVMQEDRAQQSQLIWRYLADLTKAIECRQHDLMPLLKDMEQTSLTMFTCKQCKRRLPNSAKTPKTLNLCLTCSQWTPTKKRQK